MNNFHIYEEVGKGKFSVVYKGRKKKTIDYVAVKSVEKNRRKKVLNEVSEPKEFNMLICN
jgi:serine/threonine-protein kinase ULK4